jgi:hypothetical protein
MRITLNIDDDLLRDAEASAVRTDRTLTAVVEDALRASLARMRPSGIVRPVDLPTFRGEGGLMPGLDLDDNAGLRALLDEGAPLEKRR